MEYKIKKILDSLKDEGVGVPINISTVLIELYPNVDKMNLNSVKIGWSNISKLLLNMKENKLIDYSPAMSFTFVGNATSGYNWLDSSPVMVSIRNEGVKELEEELHKSQETVLQESIIELNEINKQALTSTMNLNDVVIPRFNRSQKTLTIITIIVASLSLIAIAVSAYFSSKSPTSADIQKLDTTLQNNTRLLDSLMQIQKHH